MALKLPDYDAPDWKPDPVAFMTLHLAMLGNKPADIGHQTNQPSILVKTLLASAWAKAQIAQYHERFMSTLQAKVFEPSEKFFSKLEEKVNQLDEMTRSENPSTALRAIEIWLTNTLGTPIKRSEIKIEGTVAHASIEELRFIREFGRLPTQQEKMLLSAPSIESEVVGDSA